MELGTENGVDEIRKIDHNYGNTMHGQKDVEKKGVRIEGAEMKGVKRGRGCQREVQDEKVEERRDEKNIQESERKEAEDE